MEHTEDDQATLDGVDRGAPDPRLDQLTERAAEILRRWSEAGERQERVVEQLEAQLTEFEAANARLQRETSQKMQDLERVVEHEWTALREVHEEPIRQLREQANSLTEVCIATAHSAQRGFDLAEARLLAIESELQQRLTDLRREVQTMASDLRGNPTLARLGSSPPAWPLEGVTRLHHQLRQTAAEPVADVLDVVPVAPSSAEQERPTSAPVRVVDEPPRSEVATSSPISQEPVATAAPDSTRVTGAAESGLSASAAIAPELTERLRLLERALGDQETETREIVERARRSTSISRVAVGVMALVIVVAVAFGLWTRSQLAGRIQQAQQASQSAAELDAQAAAAREAAAREIALARELAARAQMVSSVLAAPDLIRFNLVATAENSAASAQALWSRGRGFVLSGSGITPPPPGKIYQAWLLARGQAITAGTFVPDDMGSVTLTASMPATTPPIISVVVSLEPEGGSERPDGPPVLVRTRLLQ